MSKLTELLDELCPDGVDYRPLGEVGSFTRGGGPQKKDFLSEGFPCIHYGQIYTHYGLFTATTISSVSQDVFDKSRKAQPGNVIIAVTSENDEDLGDAVAWLGSQPAAVSNHTLIYDTEMDPQYVSYFLRSAHFQRQKRRVTTGAKVRSISEKGFSSIEIPVPSLEVQQEIVRVLDAFTDLEQSLVSELELRKKQLNDYRHAHFANSKETDGCAVTLGEIAEVRSGWGFPKAYQGTLSGDLPFFKVGDMNLPGNETFLHSANNYISDTQAQELKVKPAPTGSIVFPKVGAAIATNKKRILTQESAFDNNVMSLVPGQKVDSDFLFHWIQTENLVRWGNSSGGVPSIRKSDVEKVTLILPPREQQEAVASRLNVFSNLIQSIEQEISLRRKQYEFYRDELLSFAPKEN